MAKPKRPRDPNQLAKLIVDLSTGEKSEALASESKRASIGRLGGLKGGRSRASRLTPEERKRIAKSAANARWKKR